jgi:ABC-type multidrug transport system fused ATPase/permease subunit
VSEFLSLVSRITRGHRRSFAIAVAGASTYAICTVLSAYAVRRVIDQAIAPRFDNGKVGTGAVVTAMVLITAIGVVRAGGVVVRRSFAGITEWRAAGTIASSVVDRICRQPVWWLRTRTTGDVISRMTVDAEAAVAMLAPLPFASSVVVLLGFAAVAMVLSDPILGAIGLVVIPLLAWVNLRYQRRVDALFAEAQDHLGDLSSAVHESFEAVTVVKAFGAEEREARRLSRVAERLRDARIKTVRYRSLFESLLDLIPSTAIVVLLLVGSWRVGEGRMTVGELGGFVYLFTLLSFPLRIIGYALSELPHSRAGLSHVDGVLADAVLPMAAPDKVEGVGVEIRDLVVTHLGQSEPTLVVDDLRVAPGESIAIVGETGSGKSTLVGVLAGTLAFRGSVRVGRRGVAPVFQETFLFAATLRENLLFGQVRDDDEIFEALRVADADGFVADLVDGLSTTVGERGVGLSGGQRQRLALARALLVDRDVIVLDDTTSALDPETEATVMRNLIGGIGDTTLVVVASRPSTVSLLGSVVFLVDGRVFDRGAHEELLARCPRYAELMESYESDRREQ